MSPNFQADFQEELAKQRAIRKEIEDSIRKRLKQGAENQADLRYKAQQRKKTTIELFKKAGTVIIVVALILGIIKLIAAIDENSKSDYAAVVDIPKENCVYYNMDGPASNFFECKFESPEFGGRIFVGTFEHPVKVECE